jgi:hypothetical protein
LAHQEIETQMYGYGFGREAVAAVVTFGARDLASKPFPTPYLSKTREVRTAACLGGHFFGNCTLPTANAEALFPRT